MTLAAHALAVQIEGRELVRDLDLTLEPGQFWALLGENGTGKTMLLHTLAGLLAPARGRVCIDGRDVASIDRRTRASRVGVLLQDERADYWGSVAEYVALGRLPHGATFEEPDPHSVEVDAALALFELTDQRSRPMRTLSGGERQRARLAQLATQNPAILLCDEPLNHLDLRHQVATMQFLASAATNGKVVVASLHDPRWAQACCDHAILMYHFAHIDQGLTAEVITHNALLSLYGAAVAAHPLVAAGPWRPAESNPTRGASRPTPR